MSREFMPEGSRCVSFMAGATLIYLHRDLGTLSFRQRKEITPETAAKALELGKRGIRYDFADADVRLHSVECEPDIGASVGNWCVSRDA